MSPLLRLHTEVLVSMEMKPAFQVTTSSRKVITKMYYKDGLQYQFKPIVNFRSLNPFLSSSCSTKQLRKLRVT